MSATMTIRLEDGFKERLESLASEAIREYVENNEWQIGEIRAALREADAGEFASDRQVADLAKKWKVNAA